MSLIWSGINRSKLAVAFGALLLLIISSFSTTNAQSGGVTTIRVDDTAIQQQAKRIGVNVGSRDQYGSAQIIKNLIPNPGFEAGEYGMIFNVFKESPIDRIQADNWNVAWNSDPARVGQLPGFWTGGTYEVLSGPAKGASGNITSFVYEDDKYTFYIDNNTVAFTNEDVISVRQNIAGFDADTNATNRGESGDTRPDSIGQQSLRLLPTDTDYTPSYAVYLDSFGRDADKEANQLYKMEGDYYLGFWTKGNAGDILTISMRRGGNPEFIREEITLTGEWQHIERDISIAAGADFYEEEHNAIGLAFILNSAGGEVLLDDAELYNKAESNSTAFADRYVSLLQELQPGILRNWGSQLGSSLDNQLAEPFARKMTGHSPRERVPWSFHYSFHEFLELSQAVGAEPWYVIPPTFTPEELQNLMAYLGAPAGSHPYADRRAALGQAEPWTNVFSKIHLEYGNELWGLNAIGDPFIGSSMRGGTRSGQVSNDRIGIMQSSEFYSADKYSFPIGGQTRFAGRQAELEANSSNHTAIGFAPYFGELNAFDTPENQFYPTFAHAKETVTAGYMKDSQGYMTEAAQGTQMAIYEINLHAVDGPAPVGVRDDFMTSLGSGLALPLTSLFYQRDMNITDQAVFQSLQFSTNREGEYVRGWGMMRDLQATGWKRPTWLGVELANQAIKGSMITTVTGGENPSYLQVPMNGITADMDMPFVHSFAFKDGDTYSMMVFNLDLANAHQIKLELPTAVSANATVHVLTSNNIMDNNEYLPQVQITTSTISDFSQDYSMNLAKHAAYVIEWEVGSVGNTGGGATAPQVPASPSDAMLSRVGAWWKQ